MKRVQKNHRCTVEGPHEECITACGKKFKHGEGEVNHLIVPQEPIQCKKCWPNYAKLVKLRRELKEFIDSSDFDHLDAIQTVVYLMDRKEIIRFANEIC